MTSSRIREFSALGQTDQAVIEEHEDNRKDGWGADWWRAAADFRRDVMKHRSCRREPVTVRANDYSAMPNLAFTTHYAPTLLDVYALPLSSGCKLAVECHERRPQP